MNINTKPGTGAEQGAHISKLAKVFAQQFLRKDNKFFDVDHLGTALSRNDVELMILNRIAEEFPETPLSNELITGLFELLITKRHTDRARSIQVWNGNAVCLPGNTDRLIMKRGAVAANVWIEPDYRKLKVNSDEHDVINEFLDAFFKTEAERELFMNWFAWCLQNEDSKPAWAPFFYSRSKGTGKSTVCRIMSEFFGVENTAVQNNLDKLTQQFNATVLRSKLVISEETHLQQGSSKGNAIKTYITDPFVLVEQKGKEAERARNYTCFAFTSNFLPDWMEEGERRYAVFDVDHEGRSGGEKAEAFGELVGRVHTALDQPEVVARLYNALMHRELPDDFSAKSLSAAATSTPIMQRLAQTNRQTILDELEEYLNESGYAVIPQNDLVRYICRELQANSNQTRHLMNDLSWQKVSVKWGGKDYSRSLWIRPGYAVTDGKVYGKGVDVDRIADHLAAKSPYGEVEIIE